MRKLIERCPACSAELVVTRMSCQRCDTEVAGRFETTVFDRLAPESLAFAEIFVRLRGNIKEMERELGLPYNTVRKRLDDVVSEMGYDVGADPGAGPVDASSGRGSEAVEADRAAKREEILTRLERGELDAAGAVSELEDVSEEGDAL